MPEQAQPWEREPVMTWNAGSPTQVGNGPRYGNSALPSYITNRRILDAYGIVPEQVTPARAAVAAVPDRYDAKGGVLLQRGTPAVAATPETRTPAYAYPGGSPATGGAASQAAPSTPATAATPATPGAAAASPGSTAGQHYMTGSGDNWQMAQAYNQLPRSRNPYTYGMSSQGEHQFFVPSNPADDPATAATSGNRQIGDTGLTADEMMARIYQQGQDTQRTSNYAFGAADGGTIPPANGIGLHRGYNGHVRGPGSHGGVPKFAGGGLIDSETPGRADQVNADVPAGTYIVPADVVSALGQGNTAAGGKAIDAMIEHLNRARRQQAPTPQDGYARGGKVPVRLSGGEYAISPEHVTQAGGADALDKLVMMVRQDLAKKAQTLPPPR